MARITAESIRYRQEKLRDISFEAKLARMKKLRGATGAQGEFGGPEFTRASALYGELGGMGMPGDIGGLEDLNEAERAAYVEQQEMIGGQLGTAQEEMRNLVGRMGGGGSEVIEAAEGLRVGAMGARAAALRGSFASGQQRVEARRGEALKGKETAATGFGGLAGLREAGGQWRGGQALERQRMLMSSMGVEGSDYGGYSAGGRPDTGPTMGTYGTEWSKFGKGMSPAETRMRMRNQFMWPTYRGTRDTGTTRYSPKYTGYAGRGDYNWL